MLLGAFFKRFVKPTCPGAATSKEVEKREEGIEIGPDYCIYVPADKKVICFPPKGKEARDISTFSVDEGQDLHERVDISRGLSSEGKKGGEMSELIKRSEVDMQDLEKRIEIGPDYCIYVPADKKVICFPPEEKGEKLVKREEVEKRAEAIEIGPDNCIYVPADKKVICFPPKEGKKEEGK